MNQSIEFASHVDEQLSRCLGGIPLLIPILRRLNLVEIINRHCSTKADVDSGIVALILVINRLMAPKPLYKVADWMATTVLAETLGVSPEKLHDRRIGDLLDAVYEQIDPIWREVIHQAKKEFGFRIDFIHYDITSTYFEGAYEDADKVEYGYSRDKRPDCKQINLQLNVSGEDGIPLAFKVIAGSTSDKTTPLENMGALQQLFKKEEDDDDDDFMIISDQAMLSPKVIVQYHKQGIGYLGPLANHKAYDSVLMSVSTEELLAQPLSYRPKHQPADEPEIYYGQLSQVTVFDQQTDESVITNALILYSRNKAKLDCDKRNRLLQRYVGRLETIKGYLNTRKYKKASYAQGQIDKAMSQYRSVKDLVNVDLTGRDGNLTLEFGIDQHAVDITAERDGRYLLATNRHLSEQEILTRFKQQDKVEKRNRVIKGSIQIRALFLHKQQRIESLILICMIALLTFCLLEFMAKRASIELTGTDIFDKFASLCAVYTRFNDGSCWRCVVPLTQFQRTFLERLKLSSPDIYLQSIQLE